MPPPEPVVFAPDARLDYDNGDFERRFGEVLAMGATSNRDGYWVNSALTKTKYIHYDWIKGVYVVHDRNASCTC